MLHFLNLLVPTFHQQLLLDYMNFRMLLVGFLGKAFPRAAIMNITINGFRKTGLWPPDRHEYTDAEFEALTGAAQGRCVL